MIHIFCVAKRFLLHVDGLAVLKSSVHSILTHGIIEMQFAEGFQVPGYRQDPAVIGNTGCYRLQVKLDLLSQKFSFLHFWLEGRFLLAILNIA